MADQRQTLADFQVRRSEPELVRPSSPTPTKLMPLSDIDNQKMLRMELPLILFYRGMPNTEHKDPAKVIKNALAHALVDYYPWAGRVRQHPVQKLAVDCTADGVLFVEADADIRLEDLGDQPLVPPFPYLDKLLYGGLDLRGVIDRPMLTFQVTRLSCGGFILAFKFNHTMSDGAGVLQFLTAVTEFARGASAPSVHPVWQRELLNIPDPCKVTLTPNKPIITIPTDWVRRTVIFNAGEIAALRGGLPEHLRPSTTNFELIAAALWRCRVIALEFESTEQVHLAFNFNARPVFNPRIPEGYYGNAFTLAKATTAAGGISGDGGLGYTVEQVKKAKGRTLEEYNKSLIAPGILRALHLQCDKRTYLISDMSRFGLLNLDFGWGNPVYGGPADNSSVPHLLSFITSFRNAKGGEGKVMPVYLPEDAIQRFDKALHNLLKHH